VQGTQVIYRIRAVRLEKGGFELSVLRGRVNTVDHEHIYLRLP
jgi:hypothetical protein